MRRLSPATVVLVVATLAGCGRSGPLEPLGAARTLDVLAPPANAGTIEFSIGAGFDAVCPPLCGTFSFGAGAEITLTAIEAQGAFGAWGGDASVSCGTENPCRYHPVTDQDVSADFFAHLLVTTSDAGLGVVTSAPAGIACPGTCEGDFLFGSTVTLTAVATSSLHQGWGGACAGNGDPECSLVLDEYRTVTAWFGAVAIDLYGTAADEWAEAIAVDPLIPGGYVLAGSLTEPGLVLGSAMVPIAADAGQDLFVARFAPDRIVTWVETIGGDGDIRPHALAVDDQDGVLACYLGGSFADEAQFVGADVDPQGDVNGFVSKHLDEPVPSATPEWFQAFTGNVSSNSSQVGDLAYSGNRLALTGMHNGQTIIGGQGLSGGNQDNRKHAHDAIFTSSGTLVFAVTNGQGGNSHAEGTSVIFTQAGETVTAGFRDDGVSEGPCNNGTDPNTEHDAWFFKLNTTGATCTMNTLTLLQPTGENRWSALAAGPAGVFLAVGVTRTLEPAVTVTEYSAAGVETWTREYATTVAPGAFGAEYDAARDQWVIAGSFGGNLTVEGVTSTSAGGRDVIVLRLNRSGDLASKLVTVGGTGDDVVGGPVIPGTGEFFESQMGHASSAVAILPDGVVLVAGWTESPQLAAGPFTLVNAGGSDGTADLFVLRVLAPPLD